MSVIKFVMMSYRLLCEDPSAKRLIFTISFVGSAFMAQPQFVHYPSPSVDVTIGLSITKPNQNDPK